MSYVPGNGDIKALPHIACLYALRRLMESGYSREQADKMIAEKRIQFTDGKDLMNWANEVPHAA